MAKTTKRRTSKATPTPVETYRHPEASSLLRPDVGTQAQFRKKKPPQTYRYDSSLSPALDWDGGNGARELGEWLIRCIEQAAQLPSPHTFDEVQTFKDGRGAVIATVRNLQDAVEQLRRLSGPFLNWAGKAERLSFDVPTLPLFIHERLSTQAILETLKGHKRDRQMTLLDLFGDPQHSIPDQVLRAYEHANGWTNRLILGDSLVVMNSLLHYEGLGGQVQMIYMDPPYGMKFGSNFQPFVRKRDVMHNDDEDMTREPEMVKAYRDTWEMGLHSYLTYMRDRLYLAYDLLHPSGSIFVQISDENLHHVREMMDEVFGDDNFCGVITFKKTSGATPKLLASVSDYLLWYAKDKDQTRYRQIFEKRAAIENPYERYICVETPSGEIIDLSLAQKLGQASIPEGRILRLRPTDSQGESSDSRPVIFNGREYYPPDGRHWTVTAAGTQRVVEKGRAYAVGKTLVWKSYRDEFPFRAINNNWDDITASGFGDEKLYVVQTLPGIIQRCMLMTTDPGDLVLDPTCVRKGTQVLVPSQSSREQGTPPLSPPASGGMSPPCGPPVNGGTCRVVPYNRGDHNPLPVHGEGWGGGSTPIESLTPGCFVYGHDGQSHRVVWVIEKPYQGLMVGLRHAENQEALWLTADHRVLAKKRPRSLGGHRDWSASPLNHIAARKKLRREMTPPERKLWSLLQNSRLGFKFRRQHPIGPYIADFYSRETHLVVEVDGSSHFEPDAIAYDLERDAYMRNLGLDVLRFTTREVETNPEGVCLAIQSQCQIRAHSTEGAEWVQAGSLQPGDLVFMAASPLSPRERGDEPFCDSSVNGGMSPPCDPSASGGMIASPVGGETVSPSPLAGRVGVGVVSVEIKEVQQEWSNEVVYDLEVEGVHSFMTEVCAVHNCGSGTTAYVAEQWGRRWISTDISRVPLALARQRLLTATFSYYELKDEKRGPAGGFVYRRKQNSKGEEVGGIVPHVTLKSIANDEPPEEEVLVDRPEEVGKITRVTGPFTVEATIPTPVDWEGDGEEDSGADAEDHGSFVDRMLEVLRKSPVLHVGGGKAVTLSNVRPPAKTLALSAEALVDMTAPGQRPTLQEAVQEAEEKRGQALPLSKKPVAIVFGPENGAVSEKLVYEAAREAYAKNYTHLYVIGFSIQSNARELVEKCEAVVGVPATYVQATPDLMMGDLLKNMRSSQIFSVCGLPEVRIRKVKPKYVGEPVTYQVELLGLDVFDPATMEAEHRRGDDAPAWLLDTDYNNLCFHAGQVFFPRTSAWDALKRALRGTHEDSVWDHLSGTVSAPFEAGEHGQVAVKVIDDRGNELLVVKSLKEAEG